MSLGKAFDGDTAKISSDVESAEHMDDGTMKRKRKWIHMDIPDRNSVSKNRETGNEMALRKPDK